MKQNSKQAFLMNNRKKGNKLSQTVKNAEILSALKADRFPFQYLAIDTIVFDLTLAA